MLDGQQLENHERHLLAEIADLRQEIDYLKRANRDLYLALTTTAEHGDTIEAQLQEVNEQLKVEVEERRRAEAALRTLVEVISRRKNDLEIVVQTIMEHGDVMDTHWQEKLAESDRIASIDGLTQIANRRKFDEHLKQQWKQMARDQSPLSVILCDIDHFKQFNDAYGHLAGDACLQKVAGVLGDCVKRPTDLVARFGGEEFAAILPQTEVDGALRIAEHMQLAVMQLQIPHRASKVSSVVTLSIGIACAVPTPHSVSEELIHTADRRLYQAKQAGRNQIISHFEFAQPTAL